MNPQRSLFAPELVFNLRPIRPLLRPYPVDENGNEREPTPEEEHIGMLRSPEIPPRTSGTLASEEVRIPAGNKQSFLFSPAYSFWPEKWTVKSEQDLGDLFVRTVTLGSQRLFPQYNLKPMFVSRAMGQEISERNNRYNHEGVSVKEAIQNSFTGNFMQADCVSLEIVLENRSKETLVVSLEISGQEVA